MRGNSYDPFDENRYYLYGESDSLKIQALFNKENELFTLATQIGNKFMPLSAAKDYFSQEIVRFDMNLTSRLNAGEITVDEAMQTIDNEITSLKRQDEEISRKNARQAIIVKPQNPDEMMNRAEVIDLVIAGIGFVSGGLQFIGGVMLIDTGIGAPLGALMIAHGVNNVVENGYYVLYRESYTGPTRFVYEGVGDLFGISKKDSDVIYTATDIGMSANALLGVKLEEDIARLYRYVNADLLIGLKQQGLKSMTIYDKTAELMGDANTAYGQYRAY
jgi:hypothetical protein